MLRIEHSSSIELLGEAAWRALEPPDFPFFDLEFLRALERSNSIGPGSGWSPVYLVCRDGGHTLGALCLYLKTDSYGEYIFDWEWAHAYREHGLRYYPKLVAAVPFTPATGPKLLLHPDVGRDGGARHDEARDGGARAAVVHALLDAAEKLGAEASTSSTHALFLPEHELVDFERRGFAIRHSLQFHWHNRGYDTFSDYLDALDSKRRRQVRRERRQLQGEDLTIERLTGEDLKNEHANTMYRFYTSTLDRKWGVPYLNKAFFEQAFRTMKDRILLVLARDKRTRQPVAGALNFFKGHNLYGRYWGSAQKRRNLHFELCYYQAIEFAIEHRLKLFEAGAQGSHKHARGFLPTPTYSAHAIRHPQFRHAIEHYISEEKLLLDQTLEQYANHDPYKS